MQITFSSTSRNSNILLPHIDHLLHEARKQSDASLEDVKSGLLIWSRLAYDYSGFVNF